jgi:hypothetical protein
MTRLQSLILNATGALLVLTLLGHFAFSTWNNSTADELRANQAALNNAAQVRVVLDNLAKRIALGSETDPRLRDLLIKYGLNVTLDVQGQRKAYP